LSDPILAALDPLDLAPDLLDHADHLMTDALALDVWAAVVSRAGPRHNRHQRTLTCHDHLLVRTG